MGFRLFQDERTKEFVLMRVVEGKHQGAANKELLVAIAEAFAKAVGLEVE